MKKIRIIFTGGGSGGHIYPIIAVAEKIKEIARKNNLELEMEFLGSAKNYQPILEGYGLSVKKITGSKIRRYFSLANFLEPFKFIFGLLEALVKVFFFMPDVIFSKGGPGSFSVVLAAAFYRIPIIIHESDAVPGLTNRLSAFFAKAVGVSFKSTLDFFGKKSALTGNPVRSDLLENRDEKEFAKRYWGFNPKKPLILVLGGSQGSERINDFIIQNSPEILKKYQVLHQTGELNYSQAKGELKFIAEHLNEEIKKGYQIVSYFKKDLKEALAAADIVVSRAGAGSVFEIASFGKPAILIPLSESAGDHQRFNAYQFSSFGAGLVLEESNLLPNVFTVMLKKILENKEKYQKMSELSQNFFIPNSAEMLAGEVLRIALK